MKISTRLEIHFCQQDEAAVFLENTAFGENEILSEALTYSLLTARTLTNLNNNESGTGLILVLEKIFQNPDEFFSSELGGMPKIVLYKGNAGRKIIIADMDYDEDINKLRYVVHYKGFGFLGRGVDYYSPISVTTLFRFLIERRKEDRNYLGLLVSIGSTLGNLMYSGNLTISNHHNLALKMVIGST